MLNLRFQFFNEYYFLAAEVVKAYPFKSEMCIILGFGIDTNMFCVDSLC